MALNGKGRTAAEGESKGSVRFQHGLRCTCLRCRAERGAAAAKVSAPGPPPPSVERAAAVEKLDVHQAAMLLPVPSVEDFERLKERKTAAVTNSGAVTNAARQARWRSKQDAVAIRRQAQERMKALRARRKVSGQ